MPRVPRSGDTEEVACLAEKGIGICRNELNEISLAAGIGFQIGRAHV